MTDTTRKLSLCTQSCARPTILHFLMLSHGKIVSFAQQNTQFQDFPPAHLLNSFVLNEARDYDKYYASKEI